MEAIGCAGTRQGRERENNEDANLVDDGLGLYIVADGVGGANAGELAASMATQHVASCIRGEDQRVRSGHRTRNPVDVMETAMLQASQRVRTMGDRDRKLRGMATSLTALWIQGDQAIVGHAGDCSLFRLDEGCLLKLTQEHTWAAELARRGLITEVEIEGHPYEHTLTRSLGGGQDPRVELRCVPLRAGDIFVLSTNGATSSLEGASVAGTLQREPFDHAPETLLQQAQARGSRDDATLLVVRVVDPSLYLDAPYGGRLWRQLRHRSAAA